MGSDSLKKAYFAPVPLNAVYNGGAAVGAHYQEVMLKGIFL